MIRKYSSHLDCLCNFLAAWLFQGSIELFLEIIIWVGWDRSTESEKKMYEELGCVSTWRLSDGTVLFMLLIKRAGIHCFPVETFTEFCATMFLRVWETQGNAWLDSECSILIPNDLYAFNLIGSSWLPRSHTRNPSWCKRNPASPQTCWSACCTWLDYLRWVLTLPMAAWINVRK